MKKIQTKVVIVGSGGAGLMTAIQLFENGFKDVLIVWDRKFNDAHTTQARGGINAALGTLDPEDSSLIHAVDTYREGGFIAHPDLVETLAYNAPSAIEDLLRWWADFHKEDDGKTITQRFFGAHSYRRTCFSGDQTWKEMIRVMSARARELEIPFLEETYVYKLLTDPSHARGRLGGGQKTTGILAIDKKTNEQVHVEAPIVVFATGWYPNVYFRSSSRNKENFGDAINMAYEAGVTIWDIEMVQFHPTGLLYPEEKFGELVTEAVRGEGGRLLNADGERFMKKYDPIKQELSTRDVVARANFQEIHEGRGTTKRGVWLDISHQPRDYILSRLPKMHSMILEYNGVDIAKYPVEVAPTTHYTMGWIWFDPETYETSLENFFVAGECSMGVHGANRLGGNSLMETLVFGKKVANKILDLTPTLEQPHPNPLLIGEGEEQEVCNGTLDAWDTLTEIRKQVWEYAGIVRVESELLWLQKYLADMRAKIESEGLACHGSLYENTMMHNRVQAVLNIGELICKWALERKESRGAHFRSDYLEISDSYHKNFMHTLVDGKVESKWKDLPKPSEKLQHGLDSFEETQNYGHSE